MNRPAATTTLHDVLAPHVTRGAVPGAVALVAPGGRNRREPEAEVAAVGAMDTEGSAPMARDTIFRVASVSKPLVAAAVMALVDEGRIGLYDPVAPWLPELAAPRVVRTPEAAVDDTVPAAAPVTVFDLLTFRAGYGFPTDFSLPAVQLLMSELNQGTPQPQHTVTPDEWMAKLARVPMVHQPGEGWLYNTCSDIQGVLIARASGRPLPEFLAERLFGPLGMADTGFSVPAAKLHRFPSYYHRTNGDDGTGEGLALSDPPGGQWATPPSFPSGAGGLVSTADDLLAFARMLLAKGVSARGETLLSPESVALMTTDHLTPAQRTASGLFTEGQGWGFGGSVDVAESSPWSVPGRYGWIGGTGTALHLTPSTGAVTVLLSQVAMTSPVPPVLMRDFWRYAADAGRRA
ncbi:serine hydrolase domain-containing protein [Streptomyces sp. NPDC093085]|uniref:serine hydrolase domain-containing protein n=1 Tax=Streptomyces sp. NPDC093085 TaxID=3155068 RepID=UPI00341E1546